MKYIKGTFILFVVSVLFVATNAKAAYSVTFDKISLPSLKRLVEFSTQIKNTTNLQYYFNAHTDSDDSVAVQLRYDDVYTGFQVVAENTTSTWTNNGDSSKINKKDTYTLYGKNNNNRLTAKN